jgi:hypothetical protein
MKKVHLLLLLLVPFLIFSENPEADKLSSISIKNNLAETAFQLEIPVKQLKIYLELDPDTDLNLTLEELHVSKKAVSQALAAYEESQHSFYTGIVIVGMLIVFVSLIIVGLIIQRMQSLKYLDKKKEKKISLSRVTGTNGRKISQNDIIAAITTVYLHELKTEEQSRLLLTWKRASLSLWNASAKFNMPNRVFFKDMRR